MNDDEFLLAYRMTRDSFNKLVDLLKDHDVVKIYNKDKTLNEAKTKEKTTKHLMHFLFLVRMEAELTIQIVEIATSKDMVCMKITDIDTHRLY